MSETGASKIYYEASRAAGSAAHERAPVLLVHGLAASLYDWVDFTPALNAAGYTSYALDLPGHGRSSQAMLPGQDTIEHVFRAFCEWVDELKLDQPCVLIGHSLGGYLAARYTLLHPQRVSALILCDPFVSMNQLPPLLRWNYRHGAIDATLISGTPEWLIRAVLDLAGLLIRNGHALPEEVRRQTAADYKRARPEIFNLFKEIEDISPQLANIRQPVLVTWGAHDQTLSTKSFVRLVEVLPNARGFEFARAGHVPHQSHPDEFNRIALQFLESLPG